MDHKTMVLSKERLEEAVEALKGAMADPVMRKLSQRAIQARVWYQLPILSDTMKELRQEEEAIRSRFMDQLSNLLFRFHLHLLELMDGVGADTGMADREQKTWAVVCLDAKERLYLILQQYGWLHSFFQMYPQHFYENSFQFVQRIPGKQKLPVSVKVVGMGVGGSLAVSGLAKANVQSVVGLEKRDRDRVGIRYQNTSWRGYDICEKLLDQKAYDHLLQFQQEIHVKQFDGTYQKVTSDRTQVILGEAINTAIQSAERYGADLHFGVDIDEYHQKQESTVEDCDIVALFTGAHTTELFPLLKEPLQIHSCWPEVASKCDTWLQLKKDSPHKEAFCKRDGEVGAEHWNFTIFSARDSRVDVERVRDSLLTQRNYRLRTLKDDPEQFAEYESKYTQQMQQITDVLNTLPTEDEEKSNKDSSTPRYDYIFTNAPSNPHNRAKKEEASKDGSIVMEGGYTVEVKIATNSTTVMNSKANAELLKQFKTKLVVTGGDACVPPNPMAAYGATLACMCADMLVNLAVGHGHINAIVMEMETFKNKDDTGADIISDEWIDEIKELKSLSTQFYNAHGRAENYFQWVQTLICNLYSIPPQ